MALHLLTRKSGSITILDVKGRITIGASNDSFKTEVRKLAEGGPRDVLLNLTELSQMDSSAISTLVQSYVTFKRDGGKLKILNPLGSVREVLVVTGLVNFIPTFADEAEAIASFRETAAHA
jgi:anti-anti-sigma factor